MTDSRIDQFRALLGDERFWKFSSKLIGECQQKGRLLFWQEEALKAFAAKHPVTPLPANVGELTKLFSDNGGVPSWADIISVRAGLVHGASLTVEDQSHQRTLLTLTSAERQRILRGDVTLTHKVHELAMTLVSADRPGEGLALFDDLVEVAGEFALDVFPDALQTARKHRNRATRYLECALPWGPTLTDIYVAAARLWLELGERDIAVEMLRDATRFGHNLATIRSDPQLGQMVAGLTLAADPHWLQPEALRALREIQNAGQLESVDCDVMAGLMSLEATAEWFSDWSGKVGSRGSKLRPFAYDGSGGVFCFHLALAGQPLAAQPVVYCGSEGEFLVMARDFADFLALLASGISAPELADGGYKATVKPVERLAALLKEHYPEAQNRSVKAIVTDASKLRAPSLR